MRLPAIAVSPALAAQLFLIYGLTATAQAQAPTTANAAKGPLLAAGTYLLHVDAGGGIIRQTVSIEGSTGEVDTYATGPLLAGGGCGFVKPLRGALRFRAELNVLAGIPVVSEIGSAKPQFGVNIDASVGLAYGF